MTPEQYNATRGQSLVIGVMDIIRAQHAAGKECTLWGVSRMVAEANNINTVEGRGQLYYRVRKVVRNMAAAGRIKVEKTWRKETQNTVNIIKLC